MKYQQKRMKELQKMDQNQFSSKFESEINDMSINKKTDFME
jgi:hypothetical protein